MTQKPSEKIQLLAINHKPSQQRDINALELVKGIMDYLDEEYVKNEAIINSDKTGQVGMV